jgi:hypothetical protein
MVIRIITAKRIIQRLLHTPARLLTKGKLEQAYGRCGSRNQSPYGQGIWPVSLDVKITATVVRPKCAKLILWNFCGQNPTTL